MSSFNYHQLSPDLSPRSQLPTPTPPNPPNPTPSPTPTLITSHAEHVPHAHVPHAHAPLHAATSPYPTPAPRPPLLSAASSPTTSRATSGSSLSPYEQNPAHAQVIKARLRRRRFTVQIDMPTAADRPSARSVSDLIKRVRALTLRLLPATVAVSAITDPTSRIITPQAVRAFIQAGGDFAEVVPFALLRAHALFVRDAHVNLADHDESHCRAIACEVLARRILRKLPHDRLKDVLSTRYRWVQSEGTESAPMCALELAIDEECTIFLSSLECQEIVAALWQGSLVQRYEGEDIDYVPYHAGEDAGSFTYHFDPGRLAVPRYQTLIKIAVWLFYIFVYSQVVRRPLENIQPGHKFDVWEVTLYTMTFAFFIDETHKIIKTIRLARTASVAFNFWIAVSFITQLILLASFALRLMGMQHRVGSGTRAEYLLRSFQVLSCAAPFIWIRLLTTFEGYQTVGVLQVVVFRMLRESVNFFILLTIMAIGFGQALYALDAADGTTHNDDTSGATLIANQLIQSLLGSPNFDLATARFGYPFGLIIFYGWNFITIIILVNVLIALFGTAYSDVYANKQDVYLAFLAAKTIGMIRAPDNFVYPAPFNLVETLFVAPLEPFVDSDLYVSINKVVMGVVFCVPLTIIALYESLIVHGQGRLRDFFAQAPPEDEDDPSVLNPDVYDPAGAISRVDFATLENMLPNTLVNESAAMQRDLEEVRGLLRGLEEKLAFSSEPESF